MGHIFGIKTSLRNKSHSNWSKRKTESLWLLLSIGAQHGETVWPPPAERQTKHISGRSALVSSHQGRRGGEDHLRDSRETQGPILLPVQAPGAKVRYPAPTLNPEPRILQAEGSSKKTLQPPAGQVSALLSLSSPAPKQRSQNPRH